MKLEDQKKFILVAAKVEHTLHNEDERLRLRHLGHNGEQLGGHNFTRCFGNYLVKVAAFVEITCTLWKILMTLKDEG